MGGGGEGERAGQGLARLALLAAFLDSSGSEDAAGAWDALAAAEWKVSAALWACGAAEEEPGPMWVCLDTLERYCYE